MSQKAKQFDKATLRKIGKGALIAGSGAAALVLLGFLQEVDFGIQLMNALVGSTVPIMVNAIKEWQKGA